MTIRLVYSSSAVTQKPMQTALADGPGMLPKKHTKQRLKDVNLWLQAKQRVQFMTGSLSRVDISVEQFYEILPAD